VVLASVTRRQLLSTATGRNQIGSVVSIPMIRPRADWAIDRPPKGPLADEEVRFLVIHHSASHTGHGSAEAPAIIRGFYDLHTSGRGWNDIAYNFLIDSDGGIWEGRAGSLDGPVAGDATGGNQGFTQLVCVIGNFNAAEPSKPSLASLVWLLAWLADRYGISTAHDSTVRFVSRGSNRHPAGSEVTTPTITGHRSMSRTSCPGDRLNSYVVNALMDDVEKARIDSITSSTSTTVMTTTTTPTTTSSAPVEATEVPTTVPKSATTIPLGVATSQIGDAAGIIFGTGAVVVLGIGAAMWRYRRMRRD
jgi:hypothetical protein